MFFESHQATTNDRQATTRRQATAQTTTNDRQDTTRQVTTNQAGQAYTFSQVTSQT